MDAAGTALAHLMQQRMCPVVMVMTSPRAEETSRKNELGIVDLLRPFCVLDQIDGMSFFRGFRASHPIRCGGLLS